MANAFGELLTGSFGGYLVLDHTFAIDMLFAAEPQYRFQQFVRRVNDPGAPTGKIVSVPEIGTMDLTATTALTEGTVISVERMTLATNGITITEYGRAFGWTGKLDSLSRWFDIDDITRQKLSDNYTKTMDALCRAQFFQAAANGTYITVCLGPTGTPGTIYPTATGVGTPTDEFTYNCLEHGVDQLKVRNRRKFSDETGEYYVGVFTSSQLRGLRHDPNFLNAKLYGDSRTLLRGEVGEIEGVRILESENIANYSPAGGAAAYPQGIIFGPDAVGEALSVELQLRFEPNYLTDFGRQKALAWYTIRGYGIVQGGAVQAIHSLAGKYNVR